jgi:hypothetical protein
MREDPAERAETLWHRRDCTRYHRLLKSETRNYTPFREVGRMVTDRAGPEDLVLVHSIPDGVAGVARYIEPGSGAESREAWRRSPQAQGSGG